MAKGLTPKQKAFVNEYLVDLNATAAAKRAGYSAKTAHYIGAENLTKPVIQEEIGRKMKEREKRTQITADKVIERLGKIAFSNMKDVMEWRTGEHVVGYDEDGTPIQDMVLRVHMKESDEVDGEIIQEISETRRGGDVTHTIKLNDRLKALELLGKHFGIFTEKFDIQGQMGVTIVDDIKDPEEDDDE